MFEAIPARDACRFMGAIVKTAAPILIALAVPLIHENNVDPTGPVQFRSVTHKGLSHVASASSIDSSKRRQY